MMIEEHGGGKQLARFKVVPRFSTVSLILVSFFAVLASFAALDRNTAAFLMFGAVAVLFAQRTCFECADVLALVRQVLNEYAGKKA